MSSRNAEPETVALSVLDCCERAVRGISPDYADKKDEDAQFMKRSIESIKSRLRVLKRQSAAGWKPEFARMLDQCHSIDVVRCDFEEKEGVRTDKMRCMACGRREHRCRYGLNALGGFDSKAFNYLEVDQLQASWRAFEHEYAKLGDDYPQGTRCGRLPPVDMGEYTLGDTCLRKAELYFMINTLVMELCYDANQTCHDDLNPKDPFPGAKWYYATEENAKSFMRKLEELELAVADDKRPTPDWGTDHSVWENVEKSRYKAAHDEEDECTEMLRKRAESTLARFRDVPSVHSGSEDGEESEEDDDDAQPRRGKRRRTATIIEDDSEDEEEAFEPCAAPAPARKRSAAPVDHLTSVRRSRRVQKLSPEDEAALASGPHNEGREEAPKDVEDDVGADSLEEAREAPSEEGRECATDKRVGGPRRPAANAFHMAMEQRVPGGRLPARRNALLNLGTLQLKLLREGRDDDSATCTAAFFVIQELLTRVDQLQHTVE